LLPLGRGIAWRHAIWQKSERPSTLNNVEGATVQFRVQFLDVSAAVIKEMLIDTHSEHIGKVKFKITNKGEMYVAQTRICEH
jgi:hypothetical protein